MSPLAALDALLAAVVAVAAALRCVVARPRPRRPGPPKLLVLSSFHALRTIRERELEHLLTHRDLDGFFSHVWNVHPLVGASPEHDPRPGPPTTERLAARHTVIEGRVRRYAALRRLPALNFALAQAGLLARLRRLIVDEGIAVVRGDPYYMGLLGYLLARSTGAALEVRVNANYDAIYAATGTLAYPRIFRRREVEKRVDRFVLRRADLVVVSNQNHYAWAIGSGARAEHVAFVGNESMVDPRHLAAPETRPRVDTELGLTGRPFVVCVSRLEPLKHPEDVLHALATARESRPDLAGVLVGDGSLRAELTALADALGLRGHVVFAGSRSHTWVSAALSSAAVVLSPLTGLALVEAMLSGTPVVAYDVEAQGEVISHDETGLLVPYRDTGAMGKAVVDLLADPERARRVAAAGRAAMMSIRASDRLVAQEREQVRRLLVARR